MKMKFSMFLVFGLMGMAVVASSLPDGYEELAYVESTGEQYVDSGYKVKACDTVKAVMELRRDQPGVEATAFGAQPVEPPWNNACLMDVRMGGTGHYRVWRGKGKNVYCDKPGFYGVKIAVEIDGAGFRWKPAGAAAWAEELACASTGDCAQSLYVCATHLAACDHVCPDRFAALKLYSLEITSADGTPQRTFVPCRRVRDGEAGLFDTVERRFHTNLGPSPFVLPAGTVLPWRAAPPSSFWTQRGRRCSSRWCPLRCPQCSPATAGRCSAIWAERSASLPAWTGRAPASAAGARTTGRSSPPG